MYFSLQADDWNYVAPDEGLALQDWLKNNTTKINIHKQPLDKKLSLRSDTFKSIFIAKNTCICITHIVYLLSMYSHMHNTYCLFDFHFYLQIFTGDCFSILLELSMVFGPVRKSSDTPGIKASWRRRNDISLYVPTTSQVRPK